MLASKTLWLSQLERCDRAAVFIVATRGRASEAVRTASTRWTNHGHLRGTENIAAVPYPCPVEPISQRASLSNSSDGARAATPHPGLQRRPKWLVAFDPDLGGCEQSALVPDLSTDALGHEMSPVPCGTCRRNHVHLGNRPHCNGRVAMGSSAPSPATQ